MTIALKCESFILTKLCLEFLVKSDISFASVSPNNKPGYTCPQRNLFLYQGLISAWWEFSLKDVPLDENDVTSRVT